MIVSFRHKGLEALFTEGQTKGVQQTHVKKLKQILAILNAASNIEDIKSIKSLGYHTLLGTRKGDHSLWVNKNWRVTFKFIDADVHLTNYEDYHDKKIRR